MNWQIQADEARDACSARRTLLQFLHARCTADSDFDSAELVFGELISNVVRHAPGAIKIRASFDSQNCLILQVWDSGTGFNRNPALVSVDRESGRGMFLISQFSSKFSSKRKQGGHEVSVALPAVVLATQAGQIAS